jgi:hypothetical protein
MRGECNKTDQLRAGERAYIEPTIYFRGPHIVEEDKHVDIKVVREMRRHFFVPPQAEEVFGQLAAAIPLVPAAYQPIAEAFRSNLTSVSSTVSMPFALASAGVHQQHFQRIHIAERIRTLRPGESGSEGDRQLDDKAYRIASERMQEFRSSSRGEQVIIRDICHFLIESLGHGLEAAAQELLHQGVVLLWSALEVLSRDTFEVHLNDDPNLAQRLVSDPTTRKRFEADRFPLETLIEHGFDLTGKVGSVLVAKQDFSDLVTIKAVFKVLFPASVDLARALAEPGLWLLGQQRHLIVHRRGVVDRAYLDNTGETVSKGSRLVVTPSDFERSLTLVTQTGERLLKSLVAEQPSEERGP